MEGILRLLREAGKLKKIPRTGWKTKAGIAEAESVADHSFRVGLAAMLLSDFIGLDTLKVVRMALIHDLAESITGDLTPEQVSGETDKILLEDKAMDTLLDNIPSKIKPLYIDAWREWVKGESREAKLVREVDAFEMALQAEEYIKSGYDRSKLSEFKKYAYNRVNSEVVRELLNSLG